MQHIGGTDSQSRHILVPSEIGRSKVLAQTCLLAGIISLGQASFAQDGVTDSQVEANVLKALAGPSDLRKQAISTKTVYGVVTLSGTVQTEALRIEAENLAANAHGVKKVVDEIEVPSNSATQIPSDRRSVDTQSTQALETGTPTPGMVLQSDGTYAPATPTQDGAPTPGSAPASGAVMNDPDHDQARYPQSSQQGAAPGSIGSASPQQPVSVSPAMPVPYGQTPATPPYSASAPSQPGYPAPNRYPSYPRSQSGNVEPWGGQPAGQSVVIPSGSLIRVRLDRFLASDQLKPGDVFEAFAASDVVAAGFVAIPRGAILQGTVIDARPSGAVSGRGELSVHLSSVTLAGRVYPLVTDTWARSGPDKTGQTIGNAAGFGIAGALIGAIAGRGAGAAIGAGVGAAAGVGASAASGRGQVVIPAEGTLTFHLAQPVEVSTVSEQEMQRLAYGVPLGQQPQPRQPLYVRPRLIYGYPPPPPPYGYPVY